jgi:murein DD-endopeptidase MepM/ murein hydrolase activator NlpD
MRRARAWLFCEEPLYRLIDINKNDLSSGGGAPGRVTKRGIRVARAQIVASLVSVVIVAGSVVPGMASASVLSGLFSSPVLSTRSIPGKQENLQTIELPQAAMNSNPTGRGGGDISIVDDTALLPQDGPSGTAVEIDQSAKSSQISVYVVRPGDTLSTISTMFDVSPNTVIWANDLKGASDIHPGDSLVILPMTGIRYTVKNNGTLRDIVKKYGGDLAEAALYNGVDPDESLAAGTVVIVPDGEIAAPKTVAPQKKTTPKSVLSVFAGASSVPTYSGYYMRPIVGGVRTQGIHGYNAVDLAAPVGTSLMAAASGEVIIAKVGGYNGGYGSYVVIRHGNGSQTLYAHMSRVDARVGQVVSQGEVIGAVGSTGRSTGSHVHFEIRGAANPF